MTHWHVRAIALTAFPHFKICKETTVGIFAISYFMNTILSYSINIYSEQPKTLASIQRFLCDSWEFNAIEYKNAHKISERTAKCVFPVTLL